MFSTCQKKLTVLLLALALSFASALPTFAAEKLVVTLDTAPQHVRNIWVGKFVAALEERSNGALTAEVFSSGQLFSSRDAVKAVARGDAGMAIAPLPALARIEGNLNVITLPMFNGYTHSEMNQVVDGPLGQKLSQMAGYKLRVVVPGKWWILGEENTYSTEKKINSFADLKGMQVRIPGDANWIAAYKALGANPVSMPFTDVPMALQQGTVDAIVTTDATVYLAKLNEAGLKYAFVNRVGMAYYMPIVNQKYWNSLSAAEQKLFSDTWNEFSPGQRAASIAEQVEGRQKLEAAGMVFVEPEAADLKQANSTTLATQDGLIKKFAIADEIIQLAKDSAK